MSEVRQYRPPQPGELYATCPDCGEPAVTHAGFHGGPFCWNCYHYLTHAEAIGLLWTESTRQHPGDVSEP